MLKRDFIMVQIEELGKVIAQLVSQRETGATRRIPEQIQVVYDSLKLNRDFLMDALPDALLLSLESDDRGGMLRMEIAAKALIEESYLYPGQRQQNMLQRAGVLLEYIQSNDKTFSLERLSLIENIRQIQ
ncbi:MAG: hypothetical protein LBT83_12185 [Tannerella sp.]|jgi:hypothetical protein|nr:hypothetical protein [Tannerella sp.]